MPVRKSIRISPLARQQVREVDQVAIQRYGMQGLVLMENAGRGAAEAIDGWLRARVASAPDTPAASICILCGKGNNGGDGYVIARHLQLYGYTVRIVSACEFSELKGDAAANQRIAELAEIPMQVYQETPCVGAEDQCVIECLLGTGAMGPPAEPMATMIRQANAFDGYRIAIDIPAGLDCDTGNHSETHVSCRFDMHVCRIESRLRASRGGTIHR